MRVGIFSARPDVLAWQMRTLKDFNQTACMDIDFASFGDLKSLFRSMTESPFDILLFDTEQVESLQETLVRITQVQPYCILALLSDSEQYAVMGYSVHASAYWVLPMDETGYLSSLAALIHDIPHRMERYLSIKVNGVWSRIDICSITYLESAGHTLIFHLHDGREFRMTANFRDYQLSLDSSDSLLRCHKSFVVNLSYVRDWQMDSFLLKDGTSINISRPYWQAARSAYARFVTVTQDETSPRTPRGSDGEEVSK